MIFIVLTSLLVALGILYFLGIGTFIIGLFRMKKRKNSDTPYVSVIVAARNEEKQIEDCLAALAAQTYPKENYEIIVVDDRSTDRTSEIVRQWTTQSDTVHLIRVGPEPSPLIGKKRALDMGIRNSRGEIIVTTDADCVPKTTWIRGMVSYFEPRVGLVAGYSYTEQRGEKASLFQKLRSLERIAVAAIAAGSIGWGRGLTCTGQNLAYRKKVYSDVGGFSKIGHLRSGDDDLFIQLVDRHTTWEKRYATSAETHVRTVPPTGARQSVQQEKRRASKGFQYTPWLTAFLLMTYTFNVFLFVALCLSFIHWNRFYGSWAIFGMKTALEFALLFRICTLLDRRDLLPFFPLAELLHIPYLIVFGLWGTVGTYAWK